MDSGIRSQWRAQKGSSRKVGFGTAPAAPESPLICPGDALYGPALLVTVDTSSLGILTMFEIKGITSQHPFLIASLFGIFNRFRKTRHIFCYTLERYPILSFAPYITPCLNPIHIAI